MLDVEEGNDERIKKWNQQVSGQENRGFEWGVKAGRSSCSAETGKTWRHFSKSTPRGDEVDTEVMQIWCCIRGENRRLFSTLIIARGHKHITALSFYLYLGLVVYNHFCRVISKNLSSVCIKMYYFLGCRGLRKRNENLTLLLVFTLKCQATFSLWSEELFSHRGDSGRWVNVWSSENVPLGACFSWEEKKAKYESDRA